VRHRISEKLALGAPAIADIAGALHMSPRTLQRRLADEGTSLNAIIDAVREEIARAKVLDRSLPLGEIAYLCGYSELSAFLRAFKRWTGKSPSDMRG
jgi:AraC-like DNA-binding protein